MCLAAQIKSSAKWGKVCNRPLLPSFHAAPYPRNNGAVLYPSVAASADHSTAGGASKHVHGAGTFGRVLECWDRKNKDYCAVKIVRNVKKYRDAAMIEVPAKLKPSL